MNCQISARRLFLAFLIDPSLLVHAQVSMVLITMACAELESERSCSDAPGIDVSSCVTLSHVKLFRARGKCPAHVCVIVPRRRYDSCFRGGCAAVGTSDSARSFLPLFDDIVGNIDQRSSLPHKVSVQSCCIAFGGYEVMNGGL